MRRLKLMKRLSKGFVSVLLVFAVMLGLAVPFRITVAAEGEAASGWFRNMWALVEIKNIENLDTSNCSDMSYAFYGISRVTSLDLSTFDVSKVENVRYFLDSSGITTLDIHGWKFDSLRRMEYPIKATNMTYINIDGVDISKIWEIEGFIYSCTSLETMDASSLNPRSAYDFMSVFAGDSALKKSRLEHSS